ncbi:MAG: glutamate racemase [Candidatus Paceibacterota bacterium]
MNRNSSTQARVGKIGLFDSGLGGLTILKAVMPALPQYEYRYYGDTAHVPYGDRSEEEIYELTKAGVTHLFEEGSVLVILACNTASSETLRRLQDTFLVEQYPDRKILGVIIPTIEEMIQTGAQHPLLIATKRTVESRKYDIELGKQNITDIVLTSIAAPGLVPRIEAGDVVWAEQEAAKLIGEGSATYDTVVLGCTHYCLLKDLLRQRFGESVNIISQDEIIPRKLAQYLMQHPEIETTLGRGGGYTIHLTSETPAYRESCAAFLVA